MPRKQTNQELREELERIRSERDELLALIEAAGLGLTIQQGPEHVFSYANAPFQRLAAGRELDGLTFREAFPELADQPAHMMLDAVFGAGQPAQAEATPMTLEGPGGEAFSAHVDHTTVPLWDTDGSPAGTLSLLQDATGRVQSARQVEYLLEEVRFLSEELTRSSMDGAGVPSARSTYGEQLLEVIAQGVVGVDAEGRVLFVNHAAAAMLGQAPEALRGRLFHDVAHHTRPDGRPYPWHECPLAGCMADRRRVSGEDTLVREDGSALPIAFTASPVLEGARTAGGVLVFEDATARIQAREAARRQTDEVREQVLELVSHELRTPLHVVMGFGSILGKEVAGKLSPKQHGYLDKLLGSAKVMATMLDTMLDAELAQKGQLAYSPQLLDFAELVDEAVTAHRPHALDKFQGLRVDVEADLPLLWADHGRIRQVVEILLDNAIKFTPETGVVRVHAHLEGSMLSLEVEDNGPGISIEDQGRLFHAFSTLDTSLTRQGGLGTNLALGRAIAEAHGGSLVVSSELGRGSTFRLQLPMVGSNQFMRPRIGAR